MNKLSLRYLSIFVALLLLAALATAQTAARPKISSSTQWEYLVISLGKVYFSNPVSDPDAKSSGLSKLLSFSEAGLITAQEGLSTQKSMDSLGKFGWELVGVVGAIGGDQETFSKEFTMRIARNRKKS
jgi:hypothetical protein